MFKRGVQYTREEIAKIVRPQNPPRGGDWTTGYARIDNNLFVFMNIGVAGRTGHDFENHYDETTQTLIWFSKPNRKSSNKLFQKIITGELKLHFFARWSQNPPFTFLGLGKIISFEDGYKNPQGYECIRCIVSIIELQDILTPNQEVLSDLEIYGNDDQRSSFLFEKHLEDFLVTNWNRSPLSTDYEIFQQDGVMVGQQFRTETGPIDILGLKKDRSDFLVVELKRDRASDVVVGQTLRYMGWVKDNLCDVNQNVSGCIIAQNKDDRLDYALSQVDKIQFMKFEVDFRLIS